MSDTVVRLTDMKTKEFEGTEWVSTDEAFVAITRSGARHVVDPERGRYRRSFAGQVDVWPLYAVLGDAAVGRSLLVLVVGEDDAVIALHTSPVESLSPLRRRRHAPRAA